MKAILRPAFGVAALVAGAAGSGTARADPVILTPMSDHAVLQREAPIVVTGRADPGETIAVEMGNARRTVKAGRDGAWRAVLPAMQAGGPYRLTAKGRTATAAMDDLLIGDVWLCSGQSNMEFETHKTLNGDPIVTWSTDPQIRLLSMEHKVAFSADTPLTPRPAWAAAAPASVADFSAACYLMVKQLKAERKVPMGAIDSSWGGTQIRPWIASADAAKLPGMAEDAALLALYQRDPSAGSARFAERWGTWWRGVSGETAGQEPWNAPDRRQWNPVPRLAFWEEWGVSEMADLNGTVWFRKTVELPRAGGDAVLELGGIDELDTVWVNGVAVGSSFGWGDARRYTVPARALKAGANEIVVAVTDTYGPGGLRGPVEAMKLTPAGGAAIPLGDGWRYSIAAESGATAVPRTPWESHGGLSTLYNGMIAPLGPIALKGVAWYQGESDVGKPGYDQRMAALMAGWRRQFGVAELPFLIVGLADYGSPSLAPTDSGWGVVRNEQRLAAKNDRHAAIVTAVDIGERTDIHPANKNTLAERLVRAANVVAYGDKGPASGPLIDSAVAEGADVVLRFTGVTGALHAWSAAGPIAFELCGGGACRFAEGRVEGDRVILKGDGKPVTKVRYAFADAPVVNTFDEAPLPVVPFEIELGARP
ncbi:9-O-acetylesterase [Sphingomonas spermidinifaciens]|uniref:9-O-acetylesterase n=1 Tax=Sphingomonas spermidinifaciens TaxID=1141889 RepID=A0A2A4B2X4_9SPHN|nr:sialate O-acetylesterase [Sphingomonas spermidinifaciens]PCD02315.1 9-O-acetylesterase [Sphingomonas spermidinifaciens]